MLIIKGAGPIAGTLDPGTAWSSLFAGLPDLIGAWSASALASGPVGAWRASHGAGVLSQAEPARQPVMGVVDGQAAMQFGAGKLLALAGGLGSGAELTIALRAYLADVSVDLQSLFGASSSWRGRFRNNGGSGSFDMETNAAVARRPMATPGWYDVVVVQRAAGLDMTVNDSVPITNTTSVLGVTALNIGAASSAADTGNWGGHISHVALARRALSGAALDTFKAWLAA